MSNILMTADLHLSHKNIIRHCNRPWQDVTEHDDALIDNWNSVVGKKDLVYVLGDLIMVPKQVDGTPTMKIYRRLRSRLQGRIFLIKGNHDLGSKEYYECFTGVCEGIKDLIIDKQKVTLCHYPMRSWNCSFHSSWHLFGHTHSRLENVNTGLSFDVGVDVPDWDYKPVSWEQIKEKMAKKIAVWNENIRKEGTSRM